WRVLLRPVPRPAVLDAAFERVRDQQPDLLVVKRDQLLVGVILVELRTEEHGVNARVEPVHLEVIFRLQKQVALYHDLAVPRRAGDAQPARRRTDDGPGFEQHKPVLAGGVIRMNRNEVVRRRSEDTHLLPSFFFARRITSRQSGSASAVQSSVPPIQWRHEAEIVSRFHVEPAAKQTYGGTWWFQARPLVGLWICSQCRLPDQWRRSAQRAGARGVTEPVTCAAGSSLSQR